MWIRQVSACWPTCTWRERLWKPVAPCLDIWWSGYGRAVRWICHQRVSEGFARFTRPKMKTPYGLQVSDNCARCKLRDEYSFCNFSPAVMKAFSSASHQSILPAGALLFLEGQSPRGAYVLCWG